MVNSSLINNNKVMKSLELTSTQNTEQAASMVNTERGKTSFLKE